MTYIDQAVLDFTEYLCRRFQTWTGRTNVWLAFQLTNLSVIMYFIWVASLYWLSGSLAVRVFVAVFCGGVSWMLSQTIFRMSLDVSESQAYARVAKGLRNPRRVRDAQLRIAFLTLSLVLAYPLWFAFVTLHSRFVLLTAGMIIVTTVILYLLACDPLPPCGAKFSAWLQNLMPMRRSEVRVSSERSRGRFAA